MAKSFWSKRNVGTDTTNYIRSVDAVSRPMAVLLTVVGIVVIGGLLFGIFQGARWSFAKLSGNDSSDSTEITSTTTSTDTTPGTHNTPETTPSNSTITATSSTATTTPSASSTTVAPTTSTTANASKSLPSTGPSSNVAIFCGVLLVSYLAYRKKLLKSIR